MTIENKISKIKSDITEYMNMQDRLHELRDNDNISEREFDILAVTINNRLHDFAQTLRDAQIEAIMYYDESANSEILRNKMNFELETILETVQ